MQTKRISTAFERDLSNRRRSILQDLNFSLASDPVSSKITRSQQDVPLMSNLTFLDRASLTLIFAANVLGTSSSFLFSQTTNATVLGRVNDSAGAVMRGVSVSVKNLDTGVTQSAVTDGSGQFRVGNLSIGN